MLNQMRRHAKGWMTKGILGAMTVGLIFYFGYAGVRKVTRGMSGEGKKAVAAVVNGEEIPSGKFEQAYEGQIQFYKQLTKGQIPPALEEQVKEGVLQKLIETKLFAQQAKAIGLSVSDKELLQEITSNQAFLQNGVFNKKLYLERLPSYQEEMGIDYESALREELLADKFENLIRNSVALSDAELKQEFLLANTQLNLQKVTLDTSSFKEDRENKIKEAETEILAALAEKAPAKGPSPLEALKKKYTLKIEDTGLHSLRDKVAFIGDPQATDAYDCIFKLSPENPTCLRGIAVGNDLVFLKLLEKKEPDWAKFDEQKEETRKSLLARRQALTLKQIGDSLLKQASIRLPNPLSSPKSKS